MNKPMLDPGTHGFGEHLGPLPADDVRELENAIWRAANLAERLGVSYLMFVDTCIAAFDVATLKHVKRMKARKKKARHQ